MTNSNPSIIVVKVKDEYNLVINVGSSQNVKKGDRFLVYHVDPAEILDPSTGESLGHLETVRGTGEAIHVQERMTTIRSDRKERPRKVIRRTGVGIAALMGEVVEEVGPELMPFESPQEHDLVKKI